MKVGDLIVDKEYPNEPGLILNKRNSDVCTYRVLNDSGLIMWFEREYIESDCEIISKNARK